MHYLRKPKLKRARKFVGAAQFVKNALYRAIEFVDACAFETETEVIDPGRSVAVHWSVGIPDPFDIPEGKEVPLIAYRMLHDMPPCGAHFEIISPPKGDDAVADSGIESPLNGSRPIHEAYVEPPEYEPIEDEKAIQANRWGNEITDDLDWPGSEREDD